MNACRLDTCLRHHPSESCDWDRAGNGILTFGFLSATCKKLECKGGKLFEYGYYVCYLASFVPSGLAKNDKAYRLSSKSSKGAHKLVM